MLTGLFTLRERFERQFPQGLIVPLEEESAGPGWMLNGAVALQEIPPLDEDVCYTLAGRPVLFFCSDVSAFCGEKSRAAIAAGKTQEIKGFYFQYCFDFIKYQKEILLADLATLKGYEAPEELSVIGDPHKLFVHPDARIYPGVIFDTREGGVFVDAGAQVLPPTLIQGPAYLGPGVLVDGAKIRPGCSFARGCKLAGEIEESVFLEYTNKHHDGFVGHSYAGSFVNFGALATTSDLKNTYKEIKMFCAGAWRESGTIKLGAVIGDHVKLGIGTLLNSGTQIGPGANLFVEGGMLPKYIPPFSWGGAYPFRRYRYGEFLEQTRKIMARRGKTLSTADVSRLKNIYDETGEDEYAFFA